MSPREPNRRPELAPQAQAGDIGATAAARSTESVSAQDWCHLIRRRCGLTFREAQLPALIELLQEHAQVRGFSTQAAFFDRLMAEPEDGGEWTGLMERLLNHETSFFRHPPSFEVLRYQILPELCARPSDGGTRLNFWSAGCSTGQEVYSLAMVAMADPKLAGDFLVWGGDISRMAIEMARRGRYGPRAVTGVPLEYRKRFLREVTVSGGGLEYEVTDELRQRVRFMAANLFAEWSISLNHDVIFCHNVLIYFAPTATTRLLAILAARLKPGGYLVLGPGEGPSERPPGVEAVNLNGVRAFRRPAKRSMDMQS